MTIKIRQPEDEQVAFGFMAINFLLAGMLVFTDEGINSFAFLLDFKAILFMFFVALLFSMLPNALYFGLSLLKLNKAIRLKISVAFQAVVLILISIFIFT